MKPRLAVFDMIGTLVRAGDEVPVAFRVAFDEAGIELDEEDVGRIRGRSKREAIAHLLSRHLGGTSPGEDRIDAVYARFQDALRAAYRECASAIPGAEDVLRLLRGSGIAVVLSTGLDRGTADLLIDALRLDRIDVTGVVTGDDVSRGRPAPDLIHAAMRLAGVAEPHHVLVAGDTVSDLEAAAAAGVGWSVGVLSGAHGRSQLEACPHTVLLESVAELPAWLEETGAL